MARNKLYGILIDFFSESSRKSETLQRKKCWQHSIPNVQFMHGIELFHEIMQGVQSWTLKKPQKIH